MSGKNYVANCEPHMLSNIMYGQRNVVRERERVFLSHSAVFILDLSQSNKLLWGCKQF